MAWKARALQSPSVCLVALAVAYRSIKARSQRFGRIAFSEIAPAVGEAFSLPCAVGVWVGGIETAASPDGPLHQALYVDSSEPQPRGIQLSLHHKMVRALLRILLLIRALSRPIRL
jgi:hypothetical protein